MTGAEIAGMAVGLALHLSFVWFVGWLFLRSARKGNERSVVWWDRVCWCWGGIAALSCVASQSTAGGIAAVGIAVLNHAMRDDMKHEIRMFMQAREMSNQQT